MTQQLIYHTWPDFWFTNPDNFRWDRYALPQVELTLQSSAILSSRNFFLFLLYAALGQQLTDDHKIIFCNKYFHFFSPFYKIIF
jgi:hypothetical protein